MTSIAKRLHSLRHAAILIAAALPAACIAPEAPPAPANPFAGMWQTAERQQIAFQNDTIVVRPPNEPPTPYGPQSCEGAFRFGYGRQSREALLGLAPVRQPDVRRRLAELLRQPEYPVAELTCGEGANTYVLLDDRDLVVIHRDRDIAGVERLTRL